jgi:hypothetical protein
VEEGAGRTALRVVHGQHQQQHGNAVAGQIQSQQRPDQGEQIDGAHAARRRELFFAMVFPLCVDTVKFHITYIYFNNTYF